MHLTSAAETRVFSDGSSTQTYTSETMLSLHMLMPVLTETFNTVSLPQVCDSSINASEGQSRKPWSGVEAVQWRTLEHPHVVRTLAHTTVLVPPPPPPERSARVSLDSAKSVAATPIPARGRRRARLLDEAAHRASFHSTRELDAAADHSRAFASAQPRRSSFDSGAHLRVCDSYRLTSNSAEPSCHCA